jgi:hypothetical protein
MPAAPNHIDFAEDCLARRTAARLPSFPESLHGIILTGAQGSDPFYVYGRLPWRKRPRREQVSALADIIHGGNPADVFARLVNLVAASPEERREPLAAYLYGFMLHYLLDRAVHPYVYFRTGFDAEGQPTGIYSMDHLRFETALASVLTSRRKAGKRAGYARTPVADSTTLAAVGELFAAAFPGQVEAGDFPAAWKDFVLVRRLIRDPRGIKGTVLDFFGVKTVFRAMMRPDRPSIGDKIDYANELHTVWLRPADGAPSVASVMALWEEALKDADRVGVFLEHALHAGASQKDWATALGDRDHEGRRGGETMRYYRSVYRPSDQRLP